MTRRIIAAILLSVWTTLIVGGGAAYVGVRSVLLEELDATIIERAAMVMQSSGPTVSGRPATLPRDDRYLIADESGQTIARMPIAVSKSQPPLITARTFGTLGNGQRLRTLTLLAKASSADVTESTKEREFKMVYSASADGFDRTLSQLAWLLLVGGAAAGILAALAAGLVARRALKPLHEAAALIRSIDVHHLDRRLDAQPLPPELKPFATTFNEMIEVLQEAVAQRQQFLADASHELRTPIAALLTAMEVALGRPRSEGELRMTLQRCLGNVKVLRGLVEHLLEQVRSERFSGEESVTEIDVVAIISQVVSQIAPLADRRGIRIEQLCDEHLRVTTQPHRLHSIVMNLVSNSVEHHGCGGWVRITAEAAGSDLIIAVSDDGPGIAAEHHPRIFEPFYRISSSRESSDGHMGLGLFLVQSHVRALNGRHDIESEPGKGTTIRITLPQCVALQHDPPMQPRDLAQRP